MTLHEAVMLAPAHGLLLELGVAGGASLRTIAAAADPRSVFGFDWFEGLPEDWTDEYRKGHFSTGGLPPADLPANAMIVQGLIEDTLPEFLRDHRRKVAFAHLDLDLYSSTAFALKTLAPHLASGTILALDDIELHRKNIEHAGRAWAEFGAAHEKLGPVGYEGIVVRLT